MYRSLFFKTVDLFEFLLSCIKLAHTGNQQTRVLHWAKCTDLLLRYNILDPVLFWMLLCENWRSSSSSQLCQTHTLMPLMSCAPSATSWIIFIPFQFFVTFLHPVSTSLCPAGFHFVTMPSAPSCGSFTLSLCQTTFPGNTSLLALTVGWAVQAQHPGSRLHLQVDLHVCSFGFIRSEMPGSSGTAWTLHFAVSWSLCDSLKAICSCSPFVCPCFSRRLICSLGDSSGRPHAPSRKTFLTPAFLFAFCTPFILFYDTSCNFTLSESHQEDCTLWLLSYSL